VDEPEGVLSVDGRILGTSIHGLFDEPGFRCHYLNEIRKRKGIMVPSISSYEHAKSVRMQAYDRLADLLANNLDLSSLAARVGLSTL
jgi:adenosylcobyric acid synthase